MKNSLIHKLKSKIEVEIQGKNINRFILRINNNKINIYNLKKINDEKYIIIIDYNDFEKLHKINTIYKIKILNYLGIKNTKVQFIKNIHMIFMLFLCIIFVFLLSNIIFNVEIISNDTNFKTKLYSTLRYYDIKPFSYKKDYKYLYSVKEKILKDYRSDIEWIEIERKGTKYIVRYEPRVVSEKKDINKFRHVIAKKNAIIKNIYSSNGQIVKEKNNYVKKGDIIISGYIYSNDKIKSTISADGKVYGEVWYETKVIYPFNYYEQIKTGKVKKVYSVKLLNNEYELFNFSPFNDKIEVNKIIVRNSALPFSFLKKYQEEIKIKTGMNTKEEIEVKAIKLAYEKMNKSLHDDEYIIGHKVLESKIIDKGIEMKIFFSVCENISDYLYIEELKEVD